MLAFCFGRVFKTDATCWSSSSRPSNPTLARSNPAASLRPQPPLSFQLYLPHLPNTANLILPFACPPACPPSPMIQKVGFEIQGSGGRNVAGSGVKEAERGGISPLQPFASMNQQPQNSCQVQGCWPRPGQRGGGWWGQRRVLPIPQPQAERHSSPRSPASFSPFLGYPKLIKMPAKNVPKCQTPKATANAEQEEIKDVLNASGVYIFHLLSRARHSEKAKVLQVPLQVPAKGRGFGSCCLFASPVWVE